MLRLRPENWNAVLPGYNLSWAEANRSACHANLSLIANVNRGWNDRKPAGDSPNAVLMDRVTRFYGVRPFCPDGGTYALSADGKSCKCSIHGDDFDRGFSIPINQFAAKFSSGILIGQFDRHRPDRPRVDHADETVRKYPFDRCSAS